MSYPKEVLREALHNYLVTKLSKYNFKFNEKSLKFTRTFGDIKNEICFPAAKTNYSNVLIEFDCDFVIESPKLKTWHRKTFPELVISHYLHPKNRFSDFFNNHLYHGYYDFKKHHPKDIMDAIYNNFENYGNPYFEDNNTWEKIAENTEDEEDKLNALIRANRHAEALKFCSAQLKEYLDYMENDSFKNETNSNIKESYFNKCKRLKLKEDYFKECMK